MSKNHHLVSGNGLCIHVYMTDWLINERIYQPMYVNINICTKFYMQVKCSPFFTYFHISTSYAPLLPTFVWFPTSNLLSTIVNHHFGYVHIVGVSVFWWLTRPHPDAAQEAGDTMEPPTWPWKAKLRMLISTFFSICSWASNFFITCLDRIWVIKKHQLVLFFAECCPDIEEAWKWLKMLQAQMRALKQIVGRKALFKMLRPM